MSKIYYHGSPSGELRGSHSGIHIGSHQAAKEALTARIGHPVHGSWDGSRKYGETLLAGRKTLTERKIPITGHNSDAPEDDYLPHQHTKGLPKYSNGDRVQHDHKPTMLRVSIKGAMTNLPHTAMGDTRANSTMSGQIKKGTAKKGYYYRNEGEDSGSISAVVPHHSHLEILDNSQHSENTMTHEEVLKKHGYKKQGSSNVFQHEGGHSVTVGEKGNWAHGKVIGGRNTEHTEGDSASALDAHLSKFHWYRKTTHPNRDRKEILPRKEEPEMSQHKEEKTVISDVTQFTEQVLPTAAVVPAMQTSQQFSEPFSTFGSRLAASKSTKKEG